MNHGVNSFDMTNLSDIWGAWPTLTLIVGVAAVSVSSLFSPRHQDQNERVAAAVVFGILPWLMWLLTLLLFFFVAPMSKAYSGPDPNGVARVARSYQIGLAAVIAFAFGFALALDALRFSKPRKKVSTLVCIAAYILVGFVLVKTVWMAS